MKRVNEIKMALAEDTILRAIAPAMKQRQAVRRKADRKRRVNEALARAGVPLRLLCARSGAREQETSPLCIGCRRRWSYG